MFIMTKFALTSPFITQLQSLFTMFTMPKSQLFRFVSGVTLVFLPVGHTHTTIDQYFSVVSNTIRGKDALELPSLIDATRHLFTSKGFVEHVVLEDIADFVAYFKHTLQRIGGHGTSRIDNKKRRLHLFQFFLDAEGSIVFDTTLCALV